jgi:hypothetical protein
MPQPCGDGQVSLAGVQGFAVDALDGSDGKQVQVRGAVSTPVTGVWGLSKAATFAPSAAGSLGVFSEPGKGMRGQPERTASPFCST